MYNSRSFTFNRAFLLQDICSVQVLLQVLVTPLTSSQLQGGHMTPHWNVLNYV